MRCPELVSASSGIFGSELVSLRKSLFTVPALMIRGLVAACGAVVLLSGPAALAADDLSKHFEIKAKPLADALMEFGVQAGLTVAAPTSLTAGKRSASVRGDLSPTDALGQLLKGSGLTFARVADGTMAIQAASSGSGPVRTSAVESSLEKDLTPLPLLTEAAPGAGAASAAPAGGAPAAAPGPVSCSVEMVPMRDGVKLATEVYRPVGAGKYPVILRRGPYSGIMSNFFNCDQPEWAGMAAQGYAVLSQDVRGTYRSQGTFRPIFQEGDDGYDAVEWAARQRWSSGKVGMMGGSYLGMTQWQAAIKRPPHLVTIVPSIALTSFDEAFPYQTGVFGQLLMQSWAGYMGRDQLWRKLTAAQTPPAEIAAQIAAYQRRYQEAILAPSAQGVPLASNSVFNSELTPWYNIWLSHPTMDSYWQPAIVEGKYPTLSIPVLSLGSFYDLCNLGTNDGFIGMQQHAATPRARAAAHLIMAGGGHASGKNNYVGDITFGVDNDIPKDAKVRWFDYWLKGVDNGVMNEPAVKLYVMLPPDQGSVGSGFWVSGDSFPLPGTQTTRYYLGGSHANSVAGGGTLALTPAASPGSDQYRYDPANPAPTIGGDINTDLLPGGAFDQRPVEIRPDVLVYTSAALTKPVPVLGNPTVTLTASSSAPRTAFTAKLVDVHPDGYAQIISDGIVQTDPASPNSTATYTIRMNPTGTVFKPGHQVRLEISSSNYPRFNVNTNTNELLGTAKELALAMQTVLWGGATETTLNLPIAPIAVPGQQRRIEHEL
jgi:putative CocE/NonD family hydrolase